MDSAYYERSMLSSKKLPPQSVPQSIRSSILDTYYKLCLPDKEALQAKLREVTDIALEQADK